MGKKKRVVIDLHDTSVTYVLECIRRYGWPPNPTERKLINMWKLVDWEHHFSQPYHLDFLASLTPLAGAVKGVRLLKRSKEYKPIFLTATDGDPESVRVTKKMLDLNGFPRLPLYFTNGLTNKADWLLENQDMLDVLIEDHGPTLEVALNQTAIQVIVIDAPWNRYIRAGRRVSSWAEISQILGLVEDE